MNKPKFGLIWETPMNTATYGPLPAKMAPPSPKVKPTPLHGELSSMSACIDTLEKEIAALVGKLDFVLLRPSAEGPVNGPGIEPSSGCELMDRLSAHRCRVAYLTSALIELRNRLPL